MRRSLIHYWRPHLAVVLGAAVTTAVLTGALVVGDSLRGSLEDLTLDRLGRIDWAVVAERPFRQTLAADLAARRAGAHVAPALTLRASATEPASGARASGVALWGVDPDFFSLYPSLEPVDLATRRGAFPAAAVSRALADELGATAGSELVLAFERPSDVPRETLAGRQESSETVEVLRLTVDRVLPDRGAGGFGLAPRQTRARNVFVDLRRLQRAVLARGSPRVNVLLGAGGEGESATAGLEADLDAALRLEDLGLSLRCDGCREGAEVITVQSPRFVIDDVRAAAVARVAAELEAPMQPVLTYLANAISIGGRSVPYSTIAALEPPAASALGPFRSIDGQPAPALAGDEILLNRWAAEDLAAAAGDEATVSYYALGPRDELATRTRRLRVRGVVAMEGLAVDPYLTPEFPGIEGAEDITAWNPPFPVDLSRIRPQDEAYWDEYRATPKAFVGAALGRELWGSRFGSLTSIRLAAPPGEDYWSAKGGPGKEGSGKEGSGEGGPGEGASGELGAGEADFRARVEAGLRRRLDPHTAGFAVRALREEGLRAARGATDFAGLFFGLSLFLIVSAALLAGLLFRLGVEHRAPEVGLLRAIGFPAARVRRRFLGEGLLLAVAGAALGLGGAAAYGWALLAGLRSWWLPAIGEPVLFLHLRPATLALGALASVTVVGAAVAGALRRLGRAPIVGLLAGSIGRDGRPPSRRPLWIGLVALAAAAGLTAAALGAEARAAAGLAFGVGASLLTAGVALFAHHGARKPLRANALGRGGAATMAVRNTARNRGRSLLCVTLMASACFVIVVVAANRLHGEIDVADPASGAGGFSLVAETDVPVYRELAAEGAGVAAALGGARAVPFRLLPGEDVSCLNLYQPERPRILGAPPELAGFRFVQTAGERANPWELLAEPLADGAIPAIGDANSVAWILHSGLGQDVVMENERGEPIRLRLVGLLGKSIFQSELVISEAQFERHFPSRTGYSYFLLDPPPANADAVAAALEKELGRLGFDAVATRERLAAYQAVEDTYLSTFQTLGGLGLVLGTLGMGVVLLRNVLERQAELATLSALGFRRHRLRDLVLLENAFLLLAGLTIGAAAGAAATAPHLAASGERLPWPSLALTLAAVFALGMLASTVAVRAVARLPLLASLRAR